MDKKIPGTPKQSNRGLPEIVKVGNETFRRVRRKQ